MEEQTISARFLEVLRKTQWLTPQALEAYMLPMLHRLLRHAAVQTPFYPERLAPLFNGGDPATAPIDLSRWHEVPVLRRTHVIDHLAELHARETPSDTGAAVPGTTSGTTGRAVDHLVSANARLAENCTLLRAYEEFDLDMAVPFAAISGRATPEFAYPHGAKYSAWNGSGSGAPLWVLYVGTPIAEQLAWLERIRPGHVMCYPTFLARVAELAAANGSDLRFQTFISTGEPLDPVTADRISDTFECGVIDIYAVREIGTIAFDCPVEPGHHVCAETNFVELLDDDDRPVPPGAFGRVVVTSLYNYAMPFIRYDVGDYARAATAPCRCGRGLPKLDQIGGRSRGAFLWPDGSRRQFQRPIVRDIAKHLPFREIQVVQTGPNDIELRYLPHEGGPAPDMAGLTAVFREFFNPAAVVTLKPVERLERTTGFKLEQFLSLV
jgi:phenylacetate-CoA ligase